MTDSVPTIVHCIDTTRFVAATAERIWQEYTCEATNIDFDRVGAELLVDGQRFECPGCQRMHTAGIDGPVDTVVLHPDGVLEYRLLPADALERRTWLAEVARWDRVELN